ncbi:acetate metabolism transcriptional regulator RamA [Corynebacterium propinquum]|uniref:Acetate metabolism transcriptional regulator RamA n=1 Tax=Corynebacterium propinquum TaxID=43769 RepID=A0AAP4BUI4_9CORY|nr:acetate metabolism transcriptional regulator RamA [Corynebacterium propinquum]MCG7231115.1 LuxR C-terminal-related transcriptional regulator [Corynebacterium propinquum]MCT1818899.1 LuxR C-terminal-related transcriptional regulator [Corynebacterium propinquum]MDK4252545.1 acetate metabolism transcriptional regulator RamA [Corynebacterium propinquum]MDK4326058.1 acetate metabolism transcriptional regulator RamA [Corynebacterium propinquum]MDK8665545.1 acetate metabolism transcriptional regul
MDSQLVKDDDEAIRSALTTLKNSTSIPVTMYATLLADNRLQITQWVGLRTPALQNLIMEPGTGVGGRVVSTRRPVGVSDYVRANIISHENDQVMQDEGLHSLLAVPVIVRREIRGVLYVGVHSPVRLGDKVIEEVTMTARCLEQDFAVNSALRQFEASVPATPRSNRSMNGAEWEQVRSTHSKLRMLANRVDDDNMRKEIEVLCEQMVSPVRVKQSTRLSARELDVLSCVALGHTNVEAAEEMGIGAETVKSYLRSVMRKLGAHTRYEAVNAARRIGALP